MNLHRKQPTFRITDKILTQVVAKTFIWRTPEERKTQAAISGNFAEDTETAAGETELQSSMPLFYQTPSGSAKQIEDRPQGFNGKGGRNGE